MNEYCSSSKLEQRRILTRMSFLYNVNGEQQEMMLATNYLLFANCNIIVSYLE